MHRGGVPGGMLERTDFRISAETYRAACRCGVLCAKKNRNGGVYVAENKINCCILQKFVGF